ncbi:uncharacterized protein LOC108740049 [Agrilus planipennis]|uniref:Uncharacterized protein LOC108740049 n=1 Tax=Agrilus planipennis TaxID=224129 RepID=A0A1W4XA86_AGRPL|nr:uncharacterized protein LOC108740049 [Agrilus planipennis]
MLRLLLFCLSVSALITSETLASTHTLKNHELLEKLGLVRIRGPNSHHTKRLAVESRHHSRSDDSHMFVIKLPPFPHYYVHNKPTDEGPSKKIPVGFKSNGKPSKVYHWNLPFLKKVASQKNKSRLGEDNILDMQDIKLWNEVLDKPAKDQPKKVIKPSYYVPYKPKKGLVVKYFPGNGKPKGFYVIDKSKRTQYHKLSP